MKNLSGLLEPKDDILLMVIDIQEKLFPAMDVPTQKRLTSALRLLAKCASLFALPVLVTEQYPKGLGPTIEPVLSLFPQKTVLSKTAFDSLKEATIIEHLERLGKKTILLAGMETHICVFQTALSLIDRGYRVLPVIDALASRREYQWQSAIDQLRAFGAIPMPAESAAFLLLERSGSDEFREVSRLIKEMDASPSRILGFTNS